MCNADGYVALRYIIRSTHPSLMPKPGTLCSEVPEQMSTMSGNRQVKESFGHYYRRCTDDLMFRAFLMNSEITIADPNQIDILIKNSLHFAVLDRMTSVDRKDPNKADKYKADRLLDTLQRIIDADEDSRHLRNAQTAAHTPRSDNTRGGFGCGGNRGSYGGNRSGRTPVNFLNRVEDEPGKYPTSGGSEGIS